LTRNKEISCVHEHCEVIERIVEKFIDVKVEKPVPVHREVEVYYMFM